MYYKSGIIRSVLIFVKFGEINASQIQKNLQRIYVYLKNIHTLKKNLHYKVIYQQNNAGKKEIFKNQDHTYNKWFMIYEMTLKNN